MARDMRVDLRGTLDLLILRVLLFGPAHGHAIAGHIHRTTDDVLKVETGSLYPALHKLEDAGFVRARWQLSEKGKRARYYELTAAGRKHVVRERTKWEALSNAIALLLAPGEGEHT
jgi:transcriptional regulator